MFLSRVYFRLPEGAFGRFGLSLFLCLFFCRPRFFEFCLRNAAVKEFWTSLTDNRMKVLVATEKPFAKAAVNGIKEIVEQCINKKSLLYDKNGEEHYNIISALHKSMR